MGEMNPLSLNDMEKVSGGSTKTVITNGAQVRSGPGTNYSRVGTLSSGMQVTFTGEVSYNDSENCSWFLISSPTYGWVRKNDVSNG